MSGVADTASPQKAGGRPNQREHILDVALRLMSEHGSAATSMRRLASACDLNVAALYHYFESKDAILAAVVEERRYGARMAEPTPLDPTATPVERLRAVFLELWNGAIAEEAVWRLLLGEGVRSEPGVLGVGRDLLEVLQPGLTAWIATGIPEIAEPEPVAALLIGQMLSGFIRHVFDPTAPTADIGADAWQTLAAGLGHLG